MTPADVIAEARVLLQDTKVTYRYSDAALLGFVNDGLTRMMLVRPDIFTTVGNITLTANSIVHSIPAGGVRLIDIYQLQNGAALDEVDRDLLNRAYPQWASEAAGTPTKYMRHPRNPTKFFTSPRPSTALVVIGEYVQSPTKYTNPAATITELPDGYFSALVDCVVFLAQFVDDENSSSQRATVFYESFARLLNPESRILTDSETGGIPIKGEIL